MTYLDPAKVYHYPVPSTAYPDRTVDLAALAGRLDQLPAAEQERWIWATGLHDLSVGQVVYIHSYGAFRRGVVTKLGRVNVTVAFTTEGSLDESRRWHRGVNVTEKSVKAIVVLVPRPVTEAQAEAEEALELELAEPAQSVQDALDEEEPTVDTREALNGSQRPDERVIQVELDMGLDVERSFPAVEHINPDGSSSVPPVEEPVRRYPRPGDVVTLHKGIRYYRVLAVDWVKEEARVDTVIPGTVSGYSYDGPQWVSMDLLHVVPPVVDLKLEDVGGAGRERRARDVVAVDGPGWLPDRKRNRQPATLEHHNGTVTAFLLSEDTTAIFAPKPMPVATVRVGDSLVLDGRTYRVTWTGDRKVEPLLKRILGSWM